MSKTLFYNGIIMTMDDEKRFADAVVVEGQTILYCGSYEGALAHKDENTEIVDLKGRTLTPGFNDSHMHLMSYSLSKFKADFSKGKSIENIQQILKDFAENERAKIFGDWILGHGWNQENFDEKILPTKEDLDKIVNDRPVFLARACYHICVVNSKALELAGITKDTKDPEGGRIDRDPVTGEPTGILRENALYLAYNIIPFTEDLKHIRDLILLGIEDANKVGITSIQTDDFSHLKSYHKVLEAYESLNKEGSLNARINLQMLLDSKDKLVEFLKSNIKTGDGDEYLKFGPLKILADGSLGSRTAALENPYSDDSSTDGVLIYKNEDLEDILAYAHNKGLQLAVHAIGDRCMNQILDIYQELNTKYPKDDPRFRIIHCQIGSEEIYEKFSRLRVIADIQPVFLKTDMHMAEDRVGKDRVKWSYAWKTMKEKGIWLSGSSDAPVEPFEPILGIYCTVARQDLGGYPDGGWYPEEKLDVYEAFKLFTTNSAYSTYEENTKGKIKEGMLADLIILSENVMEIPAEDLKDVKIDMTMIGGKVVYKN